MIKRINFIEKKAFSFTYLRLAQVCLIVAALNVVIIGFEYLNAIRMEKKLANKKSEQIQLEVKRNELMKKPVKQKTAVGEYQGLLDKLETSPKWSRLLNEMTDSLPNTVWITHFKTVTKTETAVVVEPTDAKSVDNKKGREKRDKKVKKKEELSVRHQLELSGLSVDVRNITEFLKKLSTSASFKHPMLSESTRESYGYVFTIKSEVAKDVP